MSDESRESEGESIPLAVSNAMVRIYKQQFGRGPTKSKTEFAGSDIVICTLEDSFTPAEKRLAEMEEHQRLRDTRLYFQHATEDDFIGAVETIIGRKVHAFISGMEPTRVEDGTLTITMPMADKPLSGIASEDIGRTALAVLKRPDLIGATISIAGDHLTGSEYAAALTEALGEEVAYRPLPWEQYRALPFPLAVEFSNMFQFYAEDSDRFTGDRDLAKVRELNPSLQSFTDWLAKHKHELKIRPL